MKKGFELNLNIVKPQHKEGTDKLKELHYKVNDVMFNYNKQYIAPKTAERLFSLLCKYGVSIKDLELPQRAIEKRDEILSALRDACNSLKNYKDNYKTTTEDKSQAQKTLNYAVSQYLTKKEEYTDEDYLKALRRNKTLYTEYNTEGLKTTAFKKMQAECLEHINSKFGI